MSAGKLGWSLIPEDLIYYTKKIFIYLLGQQVTVHLLLHWIPRGLLSETCQSLRANCISTYFPPAQVAVIKVEGRTVGWERGGERRRETGRKRCVSSLWTRPSKRYSGFELQQRTRM